MNRKITAAELGKRQPSNLEAQFSSIWRAIEGPMPHTEYQFVSNRRWRFDFAWPQQRVAVEVEGGVWTGGRHTRGSGFEKDCEKYGEATLLGWRVFRLTGGMIQPGVLKRIKEFVESAKIV